MHGHSFSTEFASEALKGAPAVGASASAAMGFLPSSWTDVAMVLTAAYVILQIAYLVWKWRRESKAGES